MVAPRQREGFDAEARAEAYLGERGLVTIERNVRFRGGEIDLVMRDGSNWVFVEVRSRRDARFGGAAASVDRRKQQRLALAAQLYLLRRFGQRGWPACRFDVVAFEAGEPRWIRGAFEAA
ncbi:MAG: YraN family protein [Burkholderiales bacterium]|nr:MAG: YraN family protein [Burkholderiales bacterium]